MCVCTCVVASMGGNAEKYFTTKTQRETAASIYMFQQHQHTPTTPPQSLCARGAAT